MNPLDLDLDGAPVLWPGGETEIGRLSIAGGRIVDAPVGRPVDLSGYLVLPGIVDLHGDGFERHLAPRRGAMTDTTEGVLAAETELAANGITTGVMAQFYSWEGGVRGPEFAARVCDAIAAARPRSMIDLITQLRFETHLLDDHAGLPGWLSARAISYVVLNDHLPHDRLAAGRNPPALTGQALKAGRSPEQHLALLQGLHARTREVPAALDRLCAQLCAAGIRIGSHDDRTAGDRADWHRRGVHIAEFPETAEAARAARDAGDHIILGAPNVVRGGSHKGNASAAGLIGMGLCDAIASDYHYPSPRRAALGLVAQGQLDLASAWRLVSAGPARVLGLDDRGSLAPGMRADLVILDATDNRVAATIANGRVAYMRGEIARRLLA